MNPSSTLLESFLSRVDPQRLSDQRERYESLISAFELHFETRQDLAFYRAPGRLEIIGNHTDHQHGQVIAAAIDRDTLALAAPNYRSEIRLISAGYDPVTVDITPSDPKPHEHFTTAGLVRGLIAGFAKAGYPVGGVDVCLNSTIPSGSGLSSSASFELVMSVIFNHLFAKDQLSPIELSKMSQWVENTYFNKPSGLMDQCAIAVGGVVAIDFNDPKQPVVTPLSLNTIGSSWTWLLVQVGHSHADLSSSYAEIVEDCQHVSAYFGKEVLREVRLEDWLKNMDSLQRAFPTRALLRAKHILEENQRVESMIEALKTQDAALVLSLIQASGDSSTRYLQNILAPNTEHQALALGLALADTLLQGRGAFRVHGGGFGGSLLMVAPTAEVQHIAHTLSKVFGEHAVMPIIPGSSGAGILFSL